MPVDDTGRRASIVLDPVSVFNRMNPSQLYEQYINCTAEFVAGKMREMVIAGGDYTSAFNYAIEFLNDINSNYAAEVAKHHATPYKQQELVNEILQDGFYIQVPPFLKGIDQDLILKLKEKYGTLKTPVTFTLPDENNIPRTYRSDRPVMIGYEYWYLLYKMPHMRSSGIGYVNQFHTPVRASPLAKMQYPFSQTPLRIGEDEVRNIVMTSGVEAAAHILGAYANSPTAVENLAHHLYFDRHPSQLKEIDLSLDEIIKTNAIVGVTKHMFSCVGINITPTPEEVQSIVAAASKVTDDEEQAIPDKEEVDTSTARD